MPQDSAQILRGLDIPQAPTPEQQLALQTAALQRQARLQQMRDARDIQTAMQQSIGRDGLPDPGEAIRLLSSNPSAQMALQDITQKSYEQQYKTRKAQLEAAQIQEKHNAQIAQALTPDNYEALLPLLPPEVQQELGPTFDQTKRDFLVQRGQTTDEFANQAKASLDRYVKGDFKRAVAEQLAVRPEMRDLVLKDARKTWGMPESEIEFWQAIPPDQLQQTARDLALGTKDRETLAGAAEVRQQNAAHDAATEAQAAANAAATDAREQQRIELEKRRVGLEAQRVAQAGSSGGSGGGSSTGTDPKDIADAIIRGEQPPVLTGLYRNAAPVRAELARKGYNLSKATEDWNATQKYLSSLNGTQQVRLRQAIAFTSSSLDLVEDLAKQWNGGGFPLLNSAQLLAAEHGALGPKAQQIATKMKAQIADLTSELGTVYKGGNSSTDESLKLASENLKTNWSRDTLLANVKQIRENLRIRQNSMSLASGAAGVNPGNPYVPPSTTAPAGKAKLVYDPKTGTFKQGGQ